MPKARKIEISQKYLLEQFIYIPETGNLFNRITRNHRAKQGAEAGCRKNPDGSRIVGINKRSYLIHRIIWIMVNGEISENLHIDHIDGNPSNNRLNNLRLVTHQENHFNETKAKGYYWDKRDSKWIAKIKVNGKHIILGYFDFEGDARRAYLNAKPIYHFIPKH